jgi:hypothetical protein
LLALPEACLVLPAFKSVQQQALDKLQQELGDLEVAWNDQGKQAMIRSL